ncbi:MAG: glutamate--tRNA ligase [Vallitaleaceae bacterium]|nr:glutamate--tRNA ligase [Vallitaleaceae bacterium]
MTKRIRTRYAPSPTGKMHVGNLRTALYAFLIAKHEDGDFLLRIEDTDQERFVEGATEIIYRTMANAGLIHDEGPDKDGGFGPYVQSERQKNGIYMKYALELVDRGEAYYCFCDKERLDEQKAISESKKEVYRYDKHCLHLSADEIKDKLESGLPYVIRQNNPTEGSTTFTDVLYGDITVDNIELEDMILIKSDGFPTYNFANVVDDHMMEISHVVRGNEYLSSSPKYNRLYEAFGWEVPVYVHCPLITDEEHKKLSKRLGHASYEDLIELGFLNEAIINFVALLGWSSKENKEIFSLDELIRDFDYTTINKSPAVFDMKKFRWMNSEYIKSMEFEAFYALVEEKLSEVIINSAYDKKKIATLAKTRMETLNDLADLIDFIQEVPEYDKELYTHKKMKTDPVISLEVLKAVLPVLDSSSEWELQKLHDRIMEFVQESEYKNGQVLWPLRTALSGKASTPGGAFDILDILGKEESMKRLRAAIEKLERELQ